MAVGFFIIVVVFIILPSGWSIWYTLRRQSYILIILTAAEKPEIQT